VRGDAAAAAAAAAGNIIASESLFRFGIVGQSFHLHSQHIFGPGPVSVTQSCRQEYGCLIQWALRSV